VRDKVSDKSTSKAKQKEKSYHDGRSPYTKQAHINILANTKHTTPSKTYNIIQLNLTETCLFSMRKSMSSVTMAGRLVG
jgi:hypothetical protein